MERLKLAQYQKKLSVLSLFTADLGWTELKHFFSFLLVHVLD